MFKKISLLFVCVLALGGLESRSIAQEADQTEPTTEGATPATAAPAKKRRLFSFANLKRVAAMGISAAQSATQTPAGQAAINQVKGKAMEVGSKVKDKAVESIKKKAADKKAKKGK